MKDDDRLVRLAAEIADGTGVPWSEIERRFAGEARELAHELRLLRSRPA